MPGTTIGRGDILYDFVVGASLTPVSVGISTSAEQSFTVKGLVVGDMVQVQLNAAQTAGLGIVNARVSAADTLTLMFMNATAGALTPAAGTYFINVNRPEFTPPANAV